MSSLRIASRKNLYEIESLPQLKKKITRRQNRLTRAAVKKRKHYHSTEHFGYNFSEATKNRFVKIFT
jgi:hypothetical protein